MAEALLEDPSFLRPFTDLLDEIEREAFSATIAPPENPRDLLTFALSSNVPPTRETDPPQPFQPHAVQRAVLEQLSDPRWRRFVIVACTQDGKTWLLILLLCWLACENKEAVIWGGPDMRIAQDVWIQKIRPAIERSGLGAFLPVTGDGSGGGANVETIQFNGGGLVILLGAGGKNRSGQAGRTARWVIVDEFGKVKRDLSTKFDRRADAFDVDGRLVKAGTVEQGDADPLLEAYADSSRAQMHWRCPHCRAYGPFEWEQVQADFSAELKAEASCRLACARCGALLTEAERQEALKDGILLHDGETVDARGVVAGDPPPTRTCGIRWGALDSPRRTLTKLAGDYAMALHAFERGNHVPLEEFFHDQLARSRPRSADESEDPEISSLIARSAAGTYDVVPIEGPGEQYCVTELPPGVGFCTYAVDQSKRRLWWMLRGHDADGRRWHLGWGRVPICGDLEEPTIAQRLQGLDQLARFAARGLRRTGGPLLPALAGIDCAYEHADTLAWVREHPGWLAIHGTGDEQHSGMVRNTGKALATSPGWYQLREHPDAHRRLVEVLWIDSDAVKTETARSLRRALDTTGTAHLPRGLAAADHLVQHLASEQRILKPGGRVTWVKRGRYNDWWDTTYVSDALARYCLDRFPERCNPDQVIGAGGGDDDRRAADDFTGHLGAW
jgi:hypothetical protein